MTRSICETYEIPHITFNPEQVTTSFQNSLNMFPAMKTVAKAIVDLIGFLDWEEFVFIYEDDEGKASD